MFNCKFFVCKCHLHRISVPFGLTLYTFLDSYEILALYLFSRYIYYWVSAHLSIWTIMIPEYFIYYYHWMLPYIRFHHWTNLFIIKYSPLLSIVVGIILCYNYQKHKFLLNYEVWFFRNFHPDFSPQYGLIWNITMFYNSERFFWVSAVYSPSPPQLSPTITTFDKLNSRITGSMIVTHGHSILSSSIIITLFQFE